MKKALLSLMCLSAMIATSIGLKAQEVTITLAPGWTWISCPRTDTLDFETALGSFTPAAGDIIKSKWGMATYIGNGQWRGTISQFYPGYGYHYKSNRTVPVLLMMGEPLSQLSVTTAEPIDVTTESAVLGGTVIIGEGNHIFARGVCWGTEPNPNFDGNHTSDDLVAGSLSFTLDNLTPGTTYYVRAYMVTDYGLAYGDQLSFTTEHEFVDLGLPSGTLWATCNIGAATPEGYGDYFAWGETEPKNDYSWSTYQYCMGTDHSLTKYCLNSEYGYNGFTDNLTTLLPEDDAATANWGNDWRMATKEEWQELYQNTTHTWVTQNGVEGRLFTASNGNSLFLPVAGYYSESNLYYAGSFGFYWSSSLNSYSSHYAEYLYFYSGLCLMNAQNRFNGRSVRAVRSADNSPIGAIDGLFSVSESQQVYFSQGNLQYRATTNTWRFAENQWDCLRLENANVSSTYDGLIDLFGWGTSGYNHGAVCYQPWSTSTNGSDYYAYGSSTYNLYDQTGQADWGYNAISNGGNTQNQWRTLTSDEWSYLLFNRDTPSGIRFAKAIVNNIEGLVVLPDNWDSSIYSLQSTNTVSATYTSNIIAENDWMSVFESHGVLFLPAGSYRNGSSYVENANKGYYWTSTRSGGSAGYFEFNNIQDESIGLFVGNRGRNQGLSVRLVRTVQDNSTYTINTTCSPTGGGTVTGAGTYNAGETCTLTATANAGYTFINWTENSEVVSTEASYSFTIGNDRDLVANFTYNDGGTHEYVDLGLPSGILWATCNVGASNPEDYGNHFAWGETQSKDSYTWNTYQYCNGSDNTITKYCYNASYGNNGYTDELTVLQPEDDAATVNWGGNWRMPTHEEWEELYLYTTHDWAYQNNVYGLLFVASNGESIFLPAAGWYDSQYHHIPPDVYYWSSSLNTNDYPYAAWSVGYYTTNTAISTNYRFRGFAVRPVCSANVPTGAINGIFSVNDSLQVCFSQGNLQYQASTNTWKFADHQYDYVGSNNSNISSTNSGWIDLFGWGTSEWHDSSDPYNVNYQPWSTSTSIVNTEYNYYGYGPSTNMSSPNLTGSSANYDWGVYNPIINGGDQPNQCRTLTQAEWGYVFNTRNTASGIRYAKAQINNVNGVILLPDNWSTSIYILSDINNSSANFSSNILTNSQWDVLEQAGAVFLPASGLRFGTSVTSVGSRGLYWSTSFSDSRQASYVSFSDSYLGPQDNYRNGGFSVRLVAPYVGLSFLSVTTAVVTDVTQTTAVCGGVVTDNGGTTVTERGICWSTGHNPTTSGSHASSGMGTGSFTVGMTGLTANTTYYVRAYATNSVGTAYGSEVSFTTLQNAGVPTVTTTEVTNISQTTAICGGVVADDGGATVTERGICWSTSPNPTINDNHVSSGSGIGSYTVNMTGLMANTTYYVRAYATNSVGTAYGNEVSFITLQDETSLPVVTTSSVYNITRNSAIGGGTVVSDGGYAVTERGICWGTSSNPTISSNHSNSGTGLGNYTVNMSGLSANKTYYVRAYAINSEGVAYGDAVQFKTPPAATVNGCFSINSNGGKICFSKGNLQCRPSTETWKFADHQYDCIGTGNIYIQQSYTGYIDLFGWGTSGYPHGAECYEPWSTSMNDENYYAYGNSTYNLYDRNGYADWGHNSISSSNKWRTLKTEEWIYIINQRYTQSGLRYAKAQVNGVNGLILLPDDWSTSYYSLNYPDQYSAGYNTNVITSSQWNTLENHGAVFLPAAGFRGSSSVFQLNSTGAYWSSSCVGVMGFDGSSVGCNTNDRHTGRSVRLVFDTH